MLVFKSGKRSPNFTATLVLTQHLASILASTLFGALWRL
jgi:hypothetical protein